MSRRHRTSPPGARQALPGAALSPEVRARQALDAGRYRDAIEFYKELLKSERRPEWVDALAQSYAGRATELASKGMLPEALVVWRNRSSLCDKPLAEGGSPYLEWLMRAGEHDAALRLLMSADADPSAAADLETRLAAVALTAPDGTLAQLAEDSPLRRHRAPALASIAACCRGDRADLDEQLRAIPFRSPYRDLRFILKALLLVGDDPSQAADLMARVAVDGPFEKLAAVVRAALLPGSRWLVPMLALDDEGRQLLLDLKGCPDNRRALLFEVAELARIGTPPTPAKVLDLLLRRGRVLPPSAARLCRRLLPYGAKRLAEYRSAFGQLAEAERECILALAIEQDGGGWIEEHWLRAVDLLSPPDKAPLHAALILRHLYEVIVGADTADADDFECIEWLERSLLLDPDDRATHLKLIRIHRQGKDLQAARASLDRALARFANDPAVLLEAVETALAGNAFKKAVTLAKRLLELDPINSKVRALIGQAHLSHARKQIRAQRADAAGREVDLAEEWLSSPNDRSIARLLRGLSASDAPATTLLLAAVAELGGGLLAAFHVLLECSRVASQGVGALRRAGIDLSRAASSREVLAVVQAINALREADERKLRTVLDPLRAPLKRAAGADFSESELISICETLLRRDEITLLQAYAGAGLKRWPERPVFVYLTIFARHGKSARFAMSGREIMALEKAAEQAQADGDQRTVARIRELVQPSPDFAGGGPDDFDDADTFGGPGEAPFEDPRALLEMMISLDNEQALISMAREIMPDAEFRPLERAAGGNRKKLARLLIDHLVELHKTVGASRSPREAPKPAPRAPVLPKDKEPVQDDRQKGLFDD